MDGIKVARAGLIDLPGFSVALRFNDQSSSQKNTLKFLLKTSEIKIYQKDLKAKFPKSKRRAILTPEILQRK